jgi:lysozyme
MVIGERMKHVWCIGLVALIVSVSGCDSPTEVEDIVQGVTIQGIDISHHNIDTYAPIDWAQVRNNGYTFAFVKATDGYRSCWTDPTFTANMDSGFQAGMLMGAYHYARPDLNHDARVEVACFLRAAGRYLRPGYLRPVLDVETGSELGKQALSQWVHTWMDTVKQQTGIEPILYTYSNFTRNFDMSVTRYALWLAHYTYDSEAEPNSGLWETWAFWQYTDRGSVPGVGDPTIDIDLFNGDLARLEREFVIPAQ